MTLSPFVGQRLGSFWVAISNTADLDTLRAMIEDGAITPAIDRVCALPDLPDAMRDLEAGQVRGKVTVTTEHQPGTWLLIDSCAPACEDHAVARVRSSRGRRA